MRTFTVILTANTNSATAGASLDVSGSVNKIGSWSRSIEKELTKVSPSEQTLTLDDPDGAIWAWIQTQLFIGAATGGVFPPWVTIDVDGQRSFIGVANPRKIDRDRKTGSLRITAQDWSSALNNKYLGADSEADDLDPLRNPWLRPYPKGIGNRSQLVQACDLVSVASTPGGYDGISWHGPVQFVDRGDFVTCDLSSTYPGFPAGKSYKIIAVGQVNDGGTYDPNYWWATTEGLGQDIWDHIHQKSAMNITANFTRVAQPTDLRSYYIVTKTVATDATGVYVLDLDQVDGIAPGDTLTTLGTATAQTWTVLQVDAQALQVVTKEEVTNVVANVSHVFFSTDSLQDLVLDDARLAIKRAVSLNVQTPNPYAVDFSRYVPPTVPNPVLVWLPLRPMDSQDLTTVRDLDQGLTNFRVFGSGTAAWDGSPEVGWTSITAALAQAPWSGQRMTAPASIMPWEGPALAVTLPLRNVVYMAGIRDLNGSTNASGAIPANTLVYDYLQMRRIQIKSDRTITINAWNGTAWGSATTKTWPGAVPVLSASVFPGQPGSILGLTSAGLQLVPLPTGTASAVLGIPADASDAVLVTTPWGAYLVGSKGYGRITYTAGALALQWLTLADNVQSFFPGTFAGLSETEVMVLARFDTAPSTDGQKVTTETHLLRLSAVPGTSASSAILAKEKLMDGVPRLAGALRDTTQPERIIGHCGGRLFVYGRTLPASYAIERYTPSGLKAIELVEHVCQILNTVAVPDPLGCLHIISRGSLGDVYPITVDREEIADTSTWEHFYSIVRVSSAKDESILSDAKGVKGGDVLEYSQHPFLWTQSGCDAVAESLSSWFGKRRGYREETWFWTDANQAAPWEALPPVATVQINGESTIWIVLDLNDDKIGGRAIVKLVEIV